MNLAQTTPAQSIEEIYRTLQQDPLTTPEELAAFYQPSINAVRGGDKIKRLEQGLNRAHQKTYYMVVEVLAKQGKIAGYRRDSRWNQLKQPRELLRIFAIACSYGRVAW
jgi:hypothetical protein